MRVLNVILTHQPHRAVARMLDWWKTKIEGQDVLIAYGGSAEEFVQIAQPQKVFISSDRLKTSDHQRERQSYQPVFQAVIKSHDLLAYDYVHLAEFDQIPLQKDVNRFQAAFLESERADVIGYRLQRIDGTNSVHYLAHAADPAFMRFLCELSVREDPTPVFSMLGFGGFWRSSAFQAVAAVEESHQTYLELFMPTVAHHLGFRLRSIPHDPNMKTWGNFNHSDLTRAQNDGSWFIHPVKNLWLTTTI